MRTASSPRVLIPVRLAMARSALVASTRMSSPYTTSMQTELLTQYLSCGALCLHLCHSSITLFEQVLFCVLCCSAFKRPEGHRGPHTELGEGQGDCDQCPRPDGESCGAAKLQVSGVQWERRLFPWTQYFVLYIFGSFDFLNDNRNNDIT